MTERYDGTARLLHWLTAALVIALITTGLVMVPLTFDQALLKYELYQWHKSIGLTVAALTLLRLVWRLRHRPAPLPAAMPAWQRATARLVHGAFYALLLALPLSGWAMVSSSPWEIPTVAFGLVDVPHLPALADLPRDVKPEVEAWFKALHVTLAILLGFTTLAHLAGALVHRLVDGERLLGRMGFRQR